MKKYSSILMGLLYLLVGCVMIYIPIFLQWMKSSFSIFGLVEFFIGIGFVVMGIYKFTQHKKTQKKLD